MTEDRARGVVLYALAVMLLGAGVLWWFHAAPRQRADTRIERWQTAAESLLPDVAGQEDAGTVALEAGADQEVVTEVGGGAYLVRMVCVGGTNSRVRVTLGSPSDDSGRGLLCDGAYQPDQFSVGSGGRLRMNVSVGAAGPVVFRYSVLRQVG